MDFQVLLVIALAALAFVAGGWIGYGEGKDAGVAAERLRVRIAEMVKR